jgi:hypothetical protein
MCPITVGAADAVASASSSPSAVAPSPPSTSGRLATLQQTKSSDPVPQVGQAQVVAHRSNALVPPVRAVQRGVEHDVPLRYNDDDFDGEELQGLDQYLPEPESSDWSIEDHVAPIVLLVSLFVAAKGCSGRPAVLPFQVSSCAHLKALTMCFCGQGGNAWNATGERDPITGKWVCGHASSEPFDIKTMGSSE